MNDKAIWRARYLRRYARHRPRPVPKQRCIYPEMDALPSRPSTGLRSVWRFSLADLLLAFRVGEPPPHTQAKPEPKPSKFVLIGEVKGVKFFRQTWHHLSRSKYANGARAQRAPQ
jgi:hypothetical protein